MQNHDEGMARKVEWKAWEKSITGQIVDSVNNLREVQGLTIKHLNVRLAAFGWPVDLATLNGILGSKKRASLSLGEIYAFARALSTTPLYLMLGIPVHVNMAPGKVFNDNAISNVELMQWLMGDNPFPPSPLIAQDNMAAAQDQEAYIRTSGDVYSLFSYGETLRALKWQNAILSELQRHDPTGTTDVVRIKHAREMVITEVESIIEIRYEYSKEDLVPLPPLPAALEFLDGDIGPDQIPLPIAGLENEELARRARLFVMDNSRMRVIPSPGGKGKAVGYVPPA